MSRPTLHYHQLRTETFDDMKKTLRYLFENASHKVHPERWQGVDVSKRPEMVSHELLNVNTTVDLRGIEGLSHWCEDIQPNLPWADDHFEERVCGYPINPGVEWANWPWGDNAAKFIEEGGIFNHNYMERYWSKYAGEKWLLPSRRGPTKTPEEWCTQFDGTAPEYNYPNFGIRHEYGDMMDLVRMLADEPLTRQAWIPIFFPEDTGIGDGGRKPCSLGYQFIMRDGKLDVYYPLRSCDFVRHWADDVYLTVRLLLWVLKQCRAINPIWYEVVPGQFVMQMTSLHIFANDYHQFMQAND